MRKGGLRTYLDALGILENGTEADIAAAKKAYWKAYHARHRQEQRKVKPEVLVALSKDDGTHAAISKGARQHKQTISAFLRTATLAYLNQYFIVPDTAIICHLEQLLSQCLNEIQTIARMKGTSHWQADYRYDATEKRIERLEQELSALFRNPPELEAQIEKAVKKKPEQKERLLAFIASL